MKHYLGIDLGGTNIAAALVDEEYRIILKHSEPTEYQAGYEAVIDHLAAVAYKTLEMANMETSDIEYVGLGLPGTVNMQEQRLVFANNLGWKNLDVVKEFRERMDIKTFIANDADCAAYGEVLAGAAKGYDNVLMLTLGTGVGGGLVLDKKIFHGGDGCGIEPGHITIKFDGEKCTCGRVGCLESYASATALIRDTVQAMASNQETLMHKMCGGSLSGVSGRTAFDAARKGDVTAQGVVEIYKSHLGVGLSSLVTIIRPQVVILGGGISNEGENLLGSVAKYVHETVYANDFLPDTPILKAKLGNDAGIIGAAFLGAQF